MQALEGLVVLDLNGIYPGAFSGMFLGDFGADVIRIDRPVGSSGGMQMDYATEEAAAYTTVHRNKRSIVLNMKSEDGQAALYKLAAKADILPTGRDLPDAQPR